MGRSKMNPVDQHRKDARKKELKKNKKQRQLIREATLKGQDPQQIIEEMEKIDQMEYNVLQPSALSAKVLQEKRRKLRGTLERVIQMYAKDDQEKCKELKNQLAQCERRRVDLSNHFEAVRSAQQVQIDEIPLPLSNSIPSSQYLPQPSPSLGTENVDLNSIPNISIDNEAPGVPAGPPPDLASEDEDSCDDSKDVDQKQQSSVPLMVLPPPPPPREGLKLPPGPPPGLPPMLRPQLPNLPILPPVQRPKLQFSNPVPNYQTQNSYNSVPTVLSAAPLINQQDSKKSTTIEAKPQIRNLTANATRFIPTSLRKKVENPKPTVRFYGKNVETQVKPTQQKSKDDTYMQFMKEMKGLL